MKTNVSIKEIKNDNISYALDIYCDKIDSTSLILHSSKGSDDFGENTF
ncbi:hypothetical protein OGZ02_13225 [Brachyspira hyodysenteriae]|nr:hypothetical protein [Brachyspira hyodysenteriae]MDA1469772.1 hypothetical protein [Brachyspira hyodysenteriae]